MILQLYILLMVISFTFILLGYALNQDAHIFKIAGFTILFMLSVMIIPNTTGGIQYKSGENVVYTYDNTTISNTALTNAYTTYENFMIGFSLALCSFFGFVNVFFQMRRNDK